ncbi:MAG: DUF350 domain-containing protein [Alphaproteobacteria bacterium]|nr:DUF350 domain-containing protein [Alphaproteobacteria bacterium]
MDAVIQSLFAGFPVLILHFLVTVAILSAGVAIYLFATPYHEIRLIRAGNTAAAVTLSGAVVGLAVPLAFCMAASVNVFDILIWGAVTVALQILVYRVVDFLLKDIPARVEADEIGPAIVLSAAKLGIAAITAAAVAG